MAEDSTPETTDWRRSSSVTLTVPEELLLLRIAWLGRDEQGLKRDPGVLANREVAAARLIELVLAKRVTVASVGRLVLRREVIVVIDATPTGDPLLDEVLERLAGADARSYSYWIKRVAKGSETAYWDRLVAKSLLRRGDLSGDPDRAVADVDAVAVVMERVRAVLAGLEGVELRDVALVTLLVATQGLYGLLHDWEFSPSGLLRGFMAQGRDDRVGRQALEDYKRFVESAPGLEDNQRDWAAAAVHAIERIAWAVFED